MWCIPRELPAVQDVVPQQLVLIILPRGEVADLLRVDVS